MPPDNTPIRDVARKVGLRLLVTAVVASLLTAGVAAGNVGFRAADPAPVDVLFVVDGSDSMGTERYELAQEMDTLRQRIEAGDVDARYALVSYNATARVEQPLTADYAAIEAAMDFPLNGSVENASAGVLTALSLDRRPDAATVVVLVTDEDDDATTAARQRAIDALSDVHFVTVSPDDTYTSSCAIHSPPCDNSSDNELRTVAAAVDGDWVDVARTDDSLGGEVNDAVAAAVGGLPEAPAADPDPDPGPTGHLDVADVDLSDRRVDPGETITVTATLRNVGDAPGRFVAWVGTTGDLRAVAPSQRVSIGRGDERTVTFEVSFRDPGTRDLVVSGHAAGRVTVERPADWADRRHANLDYDLWQRTFERAALMADPPRPVEPVPTTTREAFEARYPNLSYDAWRVAFELDE